MSVSVFVVGLIRETAAPLSTHSAVPSDRIVNGDEPKALREIVFVTVFVAGSMRYRSCVATPVAAHRLPNAYVDP